MSTVQTDSRQEIALGVQRVALKLAGIVERIRYSIGDDWSGDPAIFFRVVLSDEAQQQRELLPLTEQVRAAILDEVQPYEKGLLPYFNYRTLSDQQELRDKAWD